ncbi:MAG: hypothetical protein J5985_02590 [Kiritimatiellae bacterium]|nr:hypothetical protein [Kiritimatiellia bacterium]
MNKNNADVFAKTVDEYLATHQVTGIGDYAGFVRFAETEPVKGVVTAEVTPAHKARKVRFWGALEHLPLMRAWGLDVAEFDPDAAARGCCPDVIFCHLQPGYSRGDVDQILGAVRLGTHFVTLQNTDSWSAVFAKRFGCNYDGVLTIGSDAEGGVFFANCPKLFEGFPEGRLGADVLPFMGGNRHSMYLTGDRCLLGAADMKKRRIATSIAQYAYGKGAITLVGPCAKDLNKTGADYKRLLLNLITLLPPVCGAACR